MRPAAKREAVRHLQEQHGFSQRRACRTTNCHRRTAAHISRRSDDAPLRTRLKELAHENLRWGYKLLWGALRGQEFMVNHKKVYRLYKEEKLELRRKGKKRFKSELRGQTEKPTAPCQLWTMDFVSDALCDGRIFRTLNLVDAFTRQCLAIETDTSLSGERVGRVLDGVVAQRGKPQVIQIDNGPEFRSKALDMWACRNGVKLHFIEPGKLPPKGHPQNGLIESFNGRFRDECLNQEWFSSLKEARQLIEAWRVGYNTKRPHSSLGYLPPDTWAKRHTDSLVLFGIPQG